MPFFETRNPLYSRVLLPATIVFCLISIAGADPFFHEAPSASEQQYNQMELQRLTTAAKDLNNVKRILLLMPFSGGDCTAFAETEINAHRGDGSAQWVLAALYGSGQCVGEDSEVAFTWLKKAASSGTDVAYLDVGRAYVQGRGTEKNVHAALGWLEKAANTGEVEAYGLIALLYIDPATGMENYEQALKWSRAGAEADDPVSQLLLALILKKKGYSFYAPIESLKWTILAAGSSNETVKQNALSAKEEISKSLSGKQVQKAQRLAAQWRKANLEGRAEPTLPKVADDFADDMTGAEALRELERLGVGRDRFLFSETITQDNLGLFKLYVKAGASIEAEHRYGGTPLFWAARVNSRRVFQYLLDKGARVNVERRGDTPLSAALFAGQLDMARSLLARGADATKPGVLVAAVRFDDVELLKELVARGASVDAEWGDYVPLRKAVNDTLLEGDSTRLVCYPNAIKFLLEQGASLNWRDIVGETPLISAMRTENPIPCVEVLIQHGARTNELNAYGKSPLLAAVLGGNPDVVELLIRGGADINETYAFQESQIPMAADENLEEVLKNNGTPLMVAVALQHVSVAQILLRNGANPKRENAVGSSAISLARRTANQAMIDILPGKGP